MHSVSTSGKSSRSWAPYARNAQVPNVDYDVDSSEEERGLLQITTTTRRSKTWSAVTTLSVACGVLLLIIILQVAVMISFGSKLAGRPPAQSQLGLSTLRGQTRLAGIPSRFWDFNELEKSNEAWEGIRAGHGIVALTPEFVAAHNLPDTIDHPEDPSRKVYAIESYHMIHCLQWLRRGYVALRQGGTDEDHPLEHILHCFDALRQSIMCQANDELLTITGHGHSRGYNQTRQCRSWDALRDFATANEACYYDAPDDKSSSWSLCDNGNDGLPVGNLW